MIRRHLGTFDYTSGSGKASRQFNFVVDVAATVPIALRNTTHTSGHCSVDSRP
ncbi:hypothetical protein SAMN04489733_7229 [Amycolatopsis keratiniphila]|nr:hypothetical protein SAMN04489733_7229 [Amycolatopsis keratiniphila]